MTAEEKLEAAGLDGIVLLAGCSYDDALIGVTEEGRAVYDYEKMISWLMATEGWPASAGWHKTKKEMSKMSKVYLDTTRSGYGPDQCPPTMTVQELINLLEDLDPDAHVYLRNDGGYTYGHINRYSFEEDYSEDEEA